MSFRDILVHVDSSPESRLRLRIAVSIARRFDARLSALHVIPDPDVPPYFKPSAVERIARIYAENAHHAAAKAERLFREVIAVAEANGDWECVEGNLATRIAERARFADLLILGQFDTENPPSLSAFLLPAEIVFAAASPILVVPNAWSSTEVGTRIVACWDGSREASRAIRDAIPLLQTAEQLYLLAIDPDRQGHIREGANAPYLADHLSRHGVRAKITEVSTGQRNVTEALLGYAAEFDADLLVMGAYGHSRVWEFVAGGTTQDLLERTNIPVMMSR
jgi:nucleotide-binding universal stress UspA family protein